MLLPSVANASITSPMAVALEESARICAWVEALEDLSGLEPAEDGWITTRNAIPDALLAGTGSETLFA